MKVTCPPQETTMFREQTGAEHVDYRESCSPASLLLAWISTTHDGLAPPVTCPRSSFLSANIPILHIPGVTVYIVYIPLPTLEQWDTIPHPTGIASCCLFFCTYWNLRFVRKILLLSITLVKIQKYYFPENMHCSKK
jgi:hypothetical protein